MTRPQGFPDFFIIGAPRCGTTSLSRYLLRHPQVCFSRASPAIAVRLTRDPDTLGSALEKMRGMPVAGAFGAWIAHLSVVPSPLIGAESILGGSSVPMAPSLDRRLKALGVIGAHVAPRTGKVMPAWAWLVLTPVIALVVMLMAAVVFGLVYVSIALSGLFTWLPAVILHALIR